MPKFNRRFQRLPLLACFVLWALTGCSGFNSAAVQGVKLAFSGQTQLDVSKTPLKPQYIYLETHTPDSQSLLALAYEDTPKGQPPIDTWFSGGGEALRTQAGLLSSSGGMPGFWQNVQYTFDKEGQPTAVQFDLPKYSLYGIRMKLNNLGPVQGKYTALMQRAAKLPGIEFTVLQGQWLNTPAQLPKGVQLTPLNFVVGINKANGVPVYGLSCLQTNYCVEYLLRTAAQNL